MPFLLNRKIELLRPNLRSVGRAGGRTTTYIRRPARGALMSDRGQTELDDGVEVPTSRRRFIVRCRPNISTAWMVRIQGLYFDIVDVADVPSERRRGYLQLTLERSQRAPGVEELTTYLITEMGRRLITEDGSPLVTEQ